MLIIKAQKKAQQKHEYISLCITTMLMSIYFMHNGRKHHPRLLLHFKSSMLSSIFYPSYCDLLSLIKTIRLASDCGTWAGCKRIRGEGIRYLCQCDLRDNQRYIILYSVRGGVPLSARYYKYKKSAMIGKFYGRTYFFFFLQMEDSEIRRSRNVRCWLANHWQKVRLLLQSRC